ncbi:hypothetical protein PSTG_06479 [Puccinia striiformis f. sp. tritici PST-78]|uniref:Uncharacterized protein n=1 Tax=Puccinia striiformis f. sp. tritici PST-78 TaxID=1165861 RepID=A0A0L0VM21_9BASI|nr:hypothetical protein PSTG_06479 [Puccinia striiformis f. sp. tritici PST-78]
MPFQSSILLALLLASVAFGRSIVNLDQEMGTILHKRSPPPSSGEDHHLQYHHVNNLKFVDGIGPSIGGYGHDTDSAPNPRIQRGKGSGKGKSSNNEKKANAKAIVAQRRKVDLLRNQLEEATEKLDQLQNCSDKEKKRNAKAIAAQQKEVDSLRNQLLAAIEKLGQLQREQFRLEGKGGKKGHHKGQNPRNPAPVGNDRNPERPRGVIPPGGYELQESTPGSISTSLVRRSVNLPGDLAPVQNGDGEITPM